ncbi:MAG TPA: sigma-70 family RNA polymerase sigma factor [Chryseosolibacter sp.]|nr:sigma-70 family RNA polymerase sigma factor [Chryseosolibacter sp.]
MLINRYKKKTDEELMRLIVQGEERAFTELYTRYSGMIVRYFHRMLWKDDNKAQDFLHDLFIRIIERPEIFDPERKFSTWIYSVAHNMCKNEYRKQNFRMAAASRLHTNGVMEPGMDEQIDQASFRKRLDGVIRLWHEDDKTLFVLRHELDMAFAEIGAVLDIPEGTVRSRWFALRKNLARKFSEFQITLKD